MAATKKTTTKKTTKADTKAAVAEAEVKTEVAADTAAVDVAAKKTTTAAKKTATTTTDAKKTTVTKKTTTAAKKTAEAVKKAVEPTVEFFVEYNGVQETYASIVENVKKTYLENHGEGDVTSVRIYLKPTENAAYCVVNDEVEFRMDVYF